MRPSMVREACRQSLADLKVDYVDLYLIHLPTSLIPEFPWPLRNQNIKWNEYYDDVDYLDTWKEMEALCHEGCCKAIGLSNFSQRQVERIMQHSSLPVAAIQVECNPYLTRSGLLDFCKANKIAFVAHSPLGSPGDGHG
ncbi:aldo-keto reductase 1B-like isoform X1 [Ptychodera flava]|uniref:aldo-keto reductase 1B-like isoform X1 n=1 Tax=Ptychodera flava TaxID=63121 RepID=UPI00396A3911